MTDLLQKYFSPTQIEKIEHYYEMMIQWNKSHNLTRIVNKEHFYTHHVLDAQAISPHIPQGKRHAVDVGTGCGIPGIIMALLHPEMHWHLIDAKEKRIIFLKNVIHELKLKNAHPEHVRCEKFSCHPAPDFIISRAVSDPNTLLKLTSHLHHNHIQLLLMRAKLWEGQLIDPSWTKQEIPLDIPYSDITRHALILTQSSD